MDLNPMSSSRQVLSPSYPLTKLRLLHGLLDGKPLTWLLLLVSFRFHKSIEVSTYQMSRLEERLW